MIRLILVLLFVFLFLVLSTPLMLIEWIIGKFNQPVKDRRLPGHRQLGLSLGDPLIRHQNHCQRRRKCAPGHRRAVCGQSPQLL